MTIRQYCEKHCTDNGMWPDQAAATVKALEAEIGEPMMGRWKDDVSGYAPQFLVLLTFYLRNVALEFIDRECPKAFFRPMFVDEPAKPAEPPAWP